MLKEAWLTLKSICRPKKLAQQAASNHYSDSQQTFKYVTLFKITHWSHRVLSRKGNLTVKRLFEFSSQRLLQAVIFP